MSLSKLLFCGLDSVVQVHSLNWTEAPIIVWVFSPLKFSKLKIQDKIDSNLCLKSSSLSRSRLGRSGGHMVTPSREVQVPIGVVVIPVRGRPQSIVKSGQKFGSRNASHESNIL